MTKLWVLSDLHYEFEDAPPPLDVPADADVCVLPGDLLNKGGQRSLDYLSAQIAPHVPVVFVPGNHEFYGGSIVEGRHLMRSARLPGVHVLDDDVAVIAGVRFVGATLWTDFGLGGATEINMSIAQHLMNDYKAACWRKRPSWQRFHPRQAREMHFTSRTFIESVLRVPFDGPTVVVTHHAPHPGSIHERFRGSGLNPAFTSDLTDLIEHHEPDMWVHGHMHDGVDYEVGRTRIIANPKGYGNENPGFDPALVIDLAAPSPKP